MATPRKRLNASQHPGEPLLPALERAAGGEEDAVAAEDITVWHSRKVRV
jgi:hypothetical protein